MKGTTEEKVEVEWGSEIKGISNEVWKWEDSLEGYKTLDETGITSIEEPYRNMSIIHEELAEGN